MNFTELFNDSYARNITDNYDEFFEVFYDNFINSSDEIRLTFETMDIERQRSMLVESLLMLVNFSSSVDNDNKLKKLASLHRDKGIEASYFDVWMNTLVESIKQIDDKHSEQELLAWRVTLLPGIEFMKGFI